MPDITYTPVIIERLDTERIRELADTYTTSCGPISRAKIEACRRWVAENPEYPDGTIAVAEDDCGDEIIVQRIAGRWCHAGLHAASHPVHHNCIAVIVGAIHTPPTVRDHLHSLGFDDEMIAVTANVITISGDNDAAATLRTLRDACRKADVR